MLATTLDAATAILRADPTVTPADRNRLVALLRQPTTTASETPGARILRRTEVARRLSLSLRSIDKLAVQGVLQKVRFPGRGRSAGFRAADIEALIATGEARP